MNLLNIGVKGQLADFLFRSRHGDNITKPELLIHLLGFPFSFGLAVVVLVSDQNVQLIIVVAGSEIRDKRRCSVGLPYRQWWCHRHLWTLGELTGLRIADNSCVTAVSLVTIITIEVSIAITVITIPVSIAITVITIPVSEGSLVLLDAICVEASTGVPKEGKKENNRSDLHDLKVLLYGFNE
jgi:hypothetical protein